MDINKIIYYQKGIAICIFTFCYFISPTITLSKNIHAILETGNHPISQQNRAMMKRAITYISHSTAPCNEPVFHQSERAFNSSEQIRTVQDILFFYYSFSASETSSITPLDTIINRYKNQTQLLFVLYDVFDPSEFHSDSIYYYDQIQIASDSSEKFYCKQEVRGPVWNLGNSFKKLFDEKGVIAIKGVNFSKSKGYSKGCPKGGATTTAWVQLLDSLRYSPATTLAEWKENFIEMQKDTRNRFRKSNCKITQDIDIRVDLNQLKFKTKLGDHDKGGGIRCIFQEKAEETLTHFANEILNAPYDGKDLKLIKDDLRTNFFIDPDTSGFIQYYPNFKSNIPIPKTASAYIDMLSTLSEVKKYQITSFVLPTKYMTILGRPSGSDKDGWEANVVFTQYFLGFHKVEGSIGYLKYYDVTQKVAKLRMIKTNNMGGISYQMRIISISAPDVSNAMKCYMIKETIGSTRSVLIKKITKLTDIKGEKINCLNE